MRPKSETLIDLSLIIILIGILLAVFAILAGYSPTAMFPRARLALARARWQAAGIQNYRMDVAVIIPFSSCEYRVTVIDGKVSGEQLHDQPCVDMLFELNRSDHSRLTDGSELTVEGLFRLAESPNVSHLLFSLTGYVTELNINHCNCGPGCAMGDCVDYYRILNFEVLQEPGQ